MEAGGGASPAHPLVQDGVWGEGPYRETVRGKTHGSESHALRPLATWHAQTNSTETRPLLPWGPAHPAPPPLAPPQPRCKTHHAHHPPTDSSLPSLPEPPTQPLKVAEQGAPALAVPGRSRVPWGLLPLRRWGPCSPSLD